MHRPIILLFAFVASSTLASPALQPGDIGLRHDIQVLAAHGKVHRLGEWQDREISDPYRQSKAVFAESLKDIDDGVADWVERITA